MASDVADGGMGAFLKAPCQFPGEQHCGVANMSSPFLASMWKCSQQGKVQNSSYRSWELYSKSLGPCCTRRLKVILFLHLTCSSKRYIQDLLMFPVNEAVDSASLLGNRSCDNWIIPPLFPFIQKIWPCH